MEYASPTNAVRPQYSLDESVNSAHRAASRIESTLEALFAELNGTLANDPGAIGPAVAGLTARTELLNDRLENLAELAERIKARICQNVFELANANKATATTTTTSYVQGGISAGRGY